MTPKEFCYWLQGFFEVTEANVLTTAQMNIIKARLALVMNRGKNPPTIKSEPAQEEGEPGRKFNFDDEPVGGVGVDGLTQNKLAELDRILRGSGKEYIQKLPLVDVDLGTIGGGKYYSTTTDGTDNSIQWVPKPEWKDAYDKGKSTT